MDYEGPEAVAIHGNESLEGLSCSGTSTPNEALNIDNAKERRGVGLWYAQLHLMLDYHDFSDLHLGEN
jgi:hypothetical protein